MRLALETNQRQPRAAVVDQERPITCRLMCYKHLAVKLAVEGQLVGDATLQFVPCRACTFLLLDNSLMPAHQLPCLLLLLPLLLLLLLLGFFFAAAAPAVH